MIAPLVLFLAAVTAVLAALAVPGLGDLLLVAAPSLLASLILLLLAVRKRRRALRDAEAVPGTAKPRWTWRDLFRRPERAPPKWILVDGSNVLYWKDQTPQIDVLREVIRILVARGYTPGVVFDANAGYLVAGKYQHDRAMGALLGLPQERVIVVDKGSPADPVLLAAARDLKAPIVTNDRYRDWAEAHPEVHAPGHLIRGGFRDTGLWLDLKDSA